MPARWSRLGTTRFDGRYVTFLLTESMAVPPRMPTPSPDCLVIRYCGPVRTSTN